MRAIGSGRSRMMESAVIDLPEPDSPAMQSVSPAARSKERSSTTTREPSRSRLRSRDRGRRGRARALPSPLAGEGQGGGTAKRLGEDSSRVASDPSPPPRVPSPQGGGEVRSASLEHHAREIQRHDPVRHVDDLADPEIGADRAEHVGIDRREAVARRQHVDHAG